MTATAKTAAAPSQAAMAAVTLLMRRGARLHPTALGADIRIAGSAPRSLGHVARSVVDELDRLALIAPPAADGSRSITDAGRRCARSYRDGSGATSRSLTRAAVQPGSDNPLVWLAQRKDPEGRPLIGAPELAAGVRLAEEWRRSHLEARVTADWSGLAVVRQGGRGPGHHPLEYAESAVAARDRVMRALDAVGPELAPILVAVCCRSRGLEDAERELGWPKRSAKVVLDMALKSLARHYGLIATAPARHSSGSQVRHWGAPGYKPVVDPAPEAGG